MSPGIINPLGPGAFLGKAAKEAREHHGCSSVASGPRQWKRPRAVVDKSLEGGGKQLMKAKEAAGRELWRQMLEHH